MIDTHAHLDMLEEGAVERARAAGVSRILTIGTRDAVEIAEAHDGVHAVVGIHPHQAGEDHDLDEIRTLVQSPKAVAVGEIGLDYFRDYAPHDAQQRLFAAQLDLARELGKPVVIHARAADDDILEALRAFEGTVVLHCFSSPRLLPDALELGWYVSFAGNVTYKNAYDLRAAARRVPSDRLLAETDSPYLAPQAVRGRRNEPAYVAYTYDFLTELRGEDVRGVVAENAARVFGLPA